MKNKNDKIIIKLNNFKMLKKHPKYSRTKWSKCELTILMTLFLENKFPDITEESSIAVILDKTPKQVRVWYQNTRQRPINLNRLLLAI